MHQPLLNGVLEGQATDLEIEAREMLRLRDILFRIYANVTGKDQQVIHNDSVSEPSNKFGSLGSNIYTLTLQGFQVF